MRRPLCLLASSLVWACSPPAPPNSVPGPASSSAGASSDPTSKASKPKAGPDLKAEVGALDAQVVKKNFSSLLQRVERCQDERRKQEPRLDFLAGDVKIEIRINESGAVQSAVLLRSTVGDLATETCIIDAARALSWPRPEGGATGIASNEFSLPMKGDREATPWGVDKAESTITKASASLTPCKAGVQGTPELTLYVDTDGKVISAGASQPDPQKPGVASCLVKAAQGLKFPSPGSWPARVTIPVR